eukprot:c20810_g1_i1 orf=153-1841(+)
MSWNSAIEKHTSCGSSEESLLACEAEKRFELHQEGGICREMTFLEARQRLEASLSSPALTNKDSVYRLVSSKLAASSSSSSSPASSTPSSTDTNQYGNSVCDEMVQIRFAQVWSLLELLRSASGEENHNLAITAEDETPTEGWKLKHYTGQLRVMYREGPKGTPFHTLLAEGLIYSPITSALCLAWEAPSYNLWWPHMTVPTFKIVESKWVKRGFNGEDLSLIRVKVPWPLAAREVLMCAFELEVFDEELILVLLHSFPDTEESIHGLKPLDIPDASPNVVRMELAGGFALQRFSSEQSYFRTVANIDIKLDFVPPWIINFISRQLIGLGFNLYQKTLISINKEEGSSRHFHKLIETEPMYARIRNGLQAKKLEGDGREMASRRETAQKRPSTGDVSKATKSSKIEEKAGSSPSKTISFNSSEIAPAPMGEGVSAVSIPSNITEQSCNAGAGVDPEVQKALDVLDKMISLVQSREVGMRSNSVLMPSSYGVAGSSSPGASKHSVHTQCTEVADYGKEAALNNSAPLEQILDRRQEPNVSLQTSQIKTKHKWFCFKSSPLCCG